MCHFTPPVRFSPLSLSIWHYRLIDVLYFLFLLSNVGIRSCFFEVSNIELFFTFSLSISNPGNSFISQIKEEISKIGQ